mgnify:CR=1 FL=1
MISCWFLRREDGWKLPYSPVSSAGTNFPTLALVSWYRAPCINEPRCAIEYEGELANGFDYGRKIFTSPLMWYLFLKNRPPKLRAAYSMKNWRVPLSSLGAPSYHAKNNMLFISPFISLIHLYQTLFSPDHGACAQFFSPYGRCRFFPSCSEYAISALRQYGLFLGIMASIKRVARCHPWSRGGYDPVEP